MYNSSHFLPQLLGPFSQLTYGPRSQGIPSSHWRRQGPYTDQLQVALEQHLQLQEAYCRGGWLKLHMAFQKLTGAELTKAGGF